MDTAQPEIGKTYEDADGRKLKVKEVEPDNSRGRQVRGKITFPKGDGSEHDYACTLPAFERVWYYKTPRAKIKGAAGD